MKKVLIISLMMVTLLHYHVRPNPYEPENFIAELYFEGEGNDWIILLNNFSFQYYGLTNLDFIDIISSGGFFLFNSSFSLDLNEDFTLLTNDDLIEPVYLDRNSGSLTLIYDDWDVVYQQFDWGPPPYKSVGSILPGQSLNSLTVTVYNGFYSVWMVFKNALPYYLNPGAGGLHTGVFQGYLVDHNHQPVGNAEIKYIDDFYMPPGSYTYTPLITNSVGFFNKPYLRAKNYHLSAVIIDDIEYPIDEYLVMEPQMTITMDLSVDLSVGIAKPEKIYTVVLNNYPNPFSTQTTIELTINDKTQFSDGVINITNLSGQVISVIPLNRSKFSENIFRHEWSNKTDYNLPDGQYLISVLMDGKQVANSKMIITR